MNGLEEDAEGYETMHMIRKVQLNNIWQQNPKADNAKHLHTTLFRRILRFFGCWLGFTGLYSMTSVCPFCGQHGCPVGTGGVSIIGGFLALLAQDWKNNFKFVYHKLFKKKN